MDALIAVVVNTKPNVFTNTIPKKMQIKIKS